MSPVITVPHSESSGFFMRFSLIGEKLMEIEFRS